MPSRDPSVSPADTIRRAIDRSYEGKPDGFADRIAARLALNELLAVGERDKAEAIHYKAELSKALNEREAFRKALTDEGLPEDASVDDLIRHHRGNAALVADANAYAGRERDGRLIALAEAVDTLKNGPLRYILDRYRQDHPDDNVAVSTVIAEIQEIAAVLAGEEDAPRARTEVGFAECGDAAELAEGFAAFWHHDTTSDRLALAEWLRQLHDEVGKVLYGAGEEDANGD